MPFRWLQKYRDGLLCTMIYESTNLRQLRRGSNHWRNEAAQAVAVQDGSDQPVLTKNTNIIYPTEH